MKRNLWLGGMTALALVYGGSLSAQTGSSATAASQSDKSTITVSGCLKPADQMSSAAGAPSSSSSAARFILTNANPASASTSAPTGATTTGTTGTTSASAASTSGTTYQLEGSTSDLKDHVNHQVQITGRVEPGSSSSTSSTTATTSSASSSASAQRLHVESVKMLAATCSAKE